MLQLGTDKVLPVRVLAIVAIPEAYRVLAIIRRGYVACTESLNPSYRACTTYLRVR